MIPETCLMILILSPGRKSMQILLVLSKVLWAMNVLPGFERGPVFGSDFVAVEGRVTMALDNVRPYRCMTWNTSLLLQI